jgi:hypothetical protein
MGSHCAGLLVLLRVATLDAGPGSGDHEATWLLGHTGRITFGDLRQEDGDLYAEAVLHVPCRFLRRGEDGPSTCAAHGFRGTVPDAGAHRPEPRRLGGNRFRVVERGRVVARTLPPPVRPPRELPIHAGSNPCVGAPCRTADHTRGAACCRDLQIEIMCTPKERRLEALVRARQSPYLCKVSRESPFSLGAEMISACSFLADDRIHCSLHGRHRADGRPAKPDLCSHWPEGEDVRHPGCVFVT